MTKEEWFKVLDLWFVHNYQFYLSQDIDKDEAIRKAIIDCRFLEHYPYSPNGAVVPKEIKEEWLKSLEEDA